MKRYDFWLVIATILVLAAMGILAFAGTLWAWRAEVLSPGWSGGPGNLSYTELMNTLVAPLVAALVIILGLCIPRRLFDRQLLWASSAAMLAVAVVVAVVVDLTSGIAVFLLAAGALQATALVLTLARSGRVNYLKENVLYQVGSAILHLGFVVLVFVWAVIPPGEAHLAVFWVGSVLLVLGTAICFYREGLSKLGRRLAGRGRATPDEARPGDG